MPPHPSRRKGSRCPTAFPFGGDLLPAFSTPQDHRPPKEEGGRERPATTTVQTSKRPRRPAWASPRTHSEQGRRECRKEPRRGEPRVRQGEGPSRRASRFRCPRSPPRPRPSARAGGKASVPAAGRSPWGWPEAGRQRSESERPRPLAKRTRLGARRCWRSPAPGRQPLEKTNLRLPLAAIKDIAPLSRVLESFTRWLRELICRGSGCSCANRGACEPFPLDDRIDPLPSTVKLFLIL